MFLRAFVIGNSNQVHKNNDLLLTKLTTYSSILATPEASRAVFEAPDGTLAGVTSGKCIIDCATLAESDMQRMSDQVGSKGG